MIRWLVIALIIAGAASLVFCVIFKLLYAGPLLGSILPVAAWRLAVGCFLLAMALALLEVRNILSRK